MSTFKHKPEKLKYLSDINTVDELHKEKMDTFEKQKALLPELKNTLGKFKAVLCDDGQKLSRSEKSQLKDKIACIEDDIYNIENNIEEMEYYVMTNEILYEYYDANNKTVLIDNKDSEINNSDDIANNSISDKLFTLHEMNKHKRKIKKPIKKRNITNSINPTKSIIDFIVDGSSKIDVEQTISNKATLYNEYVALIKNDSDNTKKKPVHYICSNCNVEKTLFQSEGMYVCKQCGETEHIIIESEIPSHKDAIIEKPKYPYKKINHLIEKLNQFQSKETTCISPEVYTKIYNEIAKRNLEISSITPLFIKDTLKKYRYTQYYEHIHYIYSKITKIQPPILTREEEEQIKSMFKMIEEPYYKYRPKDRSNFLNYSFVIHKIFLILDKNEHAKYFNLLKSKDKLKLQDATWKKICEYLDWPFYPSI